MTGEEEARAEYDTLAKIYTVGIHSTPPPLPRLWDSTLYALILSFHFTCVTITIGES